MILRPYQLRAVALVRAAFARCRRVLLVLPTGAGKTATAAHLIARAVRRGRRCWFLVHRREIALDTRDRIVADGIPCGLRMAGEPETDAPVQVAMVQTVAAREVVLDLRPGDLVIWDEAHHCAAETYRVIAAQAPDVYHLGLTATPVRSDGQGLRDAFDELVAPVTVRELVALGVLAPVDVIGPPKRQAKLSATPFAAWQAHAGGRPTVAFCESVPASLAFVEALTEAGVAAAHLDGKTSKTKRERILEDFDAGRIDVLSNVFVLTEGWDSHRPTVILLARGCDGEGAFVQMIGRGRRMGDDPQKRCLLIDLCGAVWQHRMPDADREWTLDGPRKAANDNDDAIRQCGECGAVYEVKLYPRACPDGHRPPPPLPREVQLAKLAPIVSVVEREAQQEELRRLHQVARERGYRPAWVGMRFRDRFGFWPRGLRAKRSVA